MSGISTGGWTIRFKKLLSYIRGPAWYAKSIGVRVGNNCRIYTKEFGNEGYLISIGDRTTVAANAKFITHDGAGILFKGENGERLYNFGPIVIGNDVFVGANVIVLPHVKVGDKTVVAAGSVVTKSVPAGSVVAGNPARIIKSFDELQEKARKEWPSREQCLTIIHKYKTKS